MIARAIAQEPKVLLLDEPTANLDMKNQIEVMNLIEEITIENNLSTIMVMHDINLALRYSKKFIFMKAGRIFQVGGEDVINENNIKTVYNIDSTIVRVSGTPFIVPM